MTYIVTPKNKKEEKILTAFLHSLEIDFYSEAEEDIALGNAIEEGSKTALLNGSEKKDFIARLKKAK